MTESMKTKNFVAVKEGQGLSDVAPEDLLDNFYFEKQFEYENLAFLGKRRKRTPIKKVSTKIKLLKQLDGSKERVVYKNTDMKNKEEAELKQKFKYLDSSTGAFFNTALEAKKIKILKLMDEIHNLKKKRGELHRLMKIKRKKILN